MREVVIQIFDSSNNFLGSLDLERFTDFPLSLNKGIGSINDISKRETVYSLDFEVPHTQNNNVLLFGVENVNASGDSLKLIQKNNCRILVNGNQSEVGFIRIYTSSLKDKYKANFTGGNGDWVELLSGTNLNELQWKAETNTQTVDAIDTYSQARIEALNLSNVDNNDLIYPIIQRNAEEFSNETYRPQLYLRNVILRMFDLIGYTVDSTFLDSDWLKGVVVGALTYKGLSLDPAFNFEIDEDIIALTRSQAVTTESSYLLANVLGNTGAAVRNETRLNTYFDSKITDIGNNFNVSKSEYTVDRSGVYSVTFNFGDYRIEYLDPISFLWELAPIFNTNSINAPLVNVILVKNNTSDTVIDGSIIYEQTVVATFNTPVSVVAESVNLTGGDTVSFWIKITDNAFGFTTPLTSLNAPSLDKWRFFTGLDANVDFQINNVIEEGDEFRINSHIPKNIDNLTLLQDFKTMFNLYFEANSKLKTIKIEPRDDYYQNLGAAENITNLVDVSKSITVDSSNEYLRNLVFRYKDDTKDKYLDQWEVLNDRIYGQYIHDFGSDYPKGSATFETKLISPTTQNINVDDNIVTSVIRREWEDDKEPATINEDYKPRVFQVVQSRQYDALGVVRRTDEPLIVTVGLMESFGEVATFEGRQLTFNGEKGLVEQFYAKTLANVQEKRVVELFLNLPLYKFNSLDLSRPVYIDYSIPQIQGYYIIEKVNNYQLAEYKTVSVRLLKYKDFEPIIIDPSQKTNINENTNGNQGADTDFLYFIEDEGTINETLSQIYDTDNLNNYIAIYND